MSGKRLVMRAVLVVLAVAAVAGGVCLYLGISTSLHAENTLHAILATVKDVERFVAAERRWPNSWAELGPYSEEASNDAEAWRAESQRRQTYMQIDFDSGLEDIASQTPEHFTAIYPTGAYYPYTHYGLLETLLDTARQVAEGKPTGEAVPRSNIDGTRPDTWSQSTDFSIAIDGLSAENDLDAAVAAHSKLVAGGKSAFPALLNCLDDETVSHIEFQGSVEPFVPPPIGQVCFDILRLQIEGRWLKGFRDYRVINGTNISQWIEEHSSQSLAEMRRIALTQAIRNVKIQTGAGLDPEQATTLLKFLHEKMSLVEDPEFVLGKSKQNPFE